MAAPTLQVIEVTRGTTHDGPGLRTTVFLAGCPLRCTWCQNPESMAAGPDVWWEKRKCIQCRACLEACPAAALAEDDAGLHRERQSCRRCGACVEACPARAMSFTSQTWSIDALVDEALRDRDYYRAFGGGVTVSGGEPLCQYHGVAEFFRRLHEAGVHTALDTCGLATTSAFAAVLPHTDHVLYDIKLLDASQHHAHTGRTNEAILANLLSLADRLRTMDRSDSRERGNAMKLWIRTPLVPGVTATAENLTAIGQFIHDHLLDVMDRWELCAFNSACRSKYEKLGLAWTYSETPLLRQGEVDVMRAAALSSGIPDSKLVVSGLVAAGSPG